MRRFGRRNQFYKITFMLLLLPLAGCNYYRDKMDGSAEDGGGSSGTQSTEQISFKAVNDQIFIPKCISCHGSSGGINLEGYDSVHQNLDAIERAVLINKTMPKNGFLNANERTLLQKWIQAGGPKDSEPGPQDPVPPPVNPTPNPSPTPHQPPPPNSGPSIPEEKLTYQLVNREVFTPRCVRCHGDSGGVNLQSYQSVKANIKAIKRAALIEQSMPQDGQLTGRQYQILKKWIAVGAPEKGQKPNPPSNPNNPPQPPSNPPENPPEEPVVPLAPNYESIKVNIFSQRCLSCHSPNGPGERVPLVPLEDLLASPLELVIPENPDESGLVVAIERKDSKRMPPPQKGEPLTEKEIQAIKDWIKNGARD